MKRKSKVSKKTNKVSTSNQFTQNRFDVLSDSSDTMVADIEENSDSIGKSNSIAKPSPIIITDSRSSTVVVHSLFNSIDVKEFSVKRISIGYKLFVTNHIHFNKLVDLLKENKIEFYTHRSKSENFFKVVLSGLDKCDTGLIQSSLEAHHVHPTRIFEMKSKNPNSIRALYLCHFQRSKITFRQLESIKAINHTVIKWVRYQPKFKHVTQCINCYMFGHGSDHCNRPSVCNFCSSSSHKSFQCDLKSIEYTPENLSKFKCINCSMKNLSSTHKANDPSCYLKIRSNLSSSTNKNRHHKSIINFNDELFFPGSKLGDHQHKTNKIHESTIPANKPSSSNDQHTYNSSTADMFSIGECFNIFYKAVNNIKKCKSKIEQMAIIADLIQQTLV